MREAETKNKSTVNARGRVISAILYYYHRYYDIMVCCKDELCIVTCVRVSVKLHALRYV